jgi:hypothetical protein
VCVVCPTAGNEAIPVDEAGNPKLKDIGLFLKAAIKQHLPDTDVKYIDPSNMVQVSTCTVFPCVSCSSWG